MPYELFYGQPFAPGVGAQIFQGAQNATTFSRIMENNKVVLANRAQDLQEAELVQRGDLAKLAALRDERQQAQQAQQQRADLQLRQEGLARQSASDAAHLSLATNAQAIGQSQFATDTKMKQDAFDLDKQKLAETMREHDLVANAKNTTGAAKVWTDYADKMQSNVKFKLDQVGKDMDRIVADRQKDRGSLELLASTTLPNGNPKPATVLAANKTELDRRTKRENDFQTLDAQRKLNERQLQFYTDQVTASGRPGYIPPFMLPSYTGAVAPESIEAWQWIQQNPDSSFAAPMIQRLKSLYPWK